MPQKNYYRLFCIQCYDYKKHSMIDFSDKWNCSTCNREYSYTPLSKIPEDKVLEQQGRYKQKKSNDIQRVLNFYSNSNFSTLLENEMEETDAGYNAIEDKKKSDRQAKMKFEKEEKIKYDRVERNTPCLCGSGIKYKKCCMPRILSYN